MSFFLALFVIICSAVVLEVIGYQVYGVWGLLVASVAIMLIVVLREIIGGTNG